MIDQLEALGVVDFEARRALQRVVDGHSSLSPQLRADATAAIEAHEQQLATRAVLEAHADVLASLGYIVDGGFSSMAVREGCVEFRRPEWGDHWIRLALVPGSGTITYQLMGTERPDTIDSWCHKDLPTLQRALSQAGIPLQQSGSALDTGHLATAEAESDAEASASRARFQSTDRS
jgi:hypothetical protein